MNTLSKDKLVSIKNKFDTLMENKIRLVEDKEALRAINDMPFYKVKNLFEGMSEKIFIDENNKKLIGKYIQVIKENKPLATLSRITEMVNKAEIPDNVDTTSYLNECIRLIVSQNGKKLNEALVQLRKIVRECAKVALLSASDIENLSNGSNNAVNESFNYIISNKVSPNTLNEYLSNFTTVKNYLTENKSYKSDENKETTSTFDDVITENLEEWEKTAVNDIALNSLSGKNGAELFERYKNECISLIQESIDDEDLENRARLETMKLQLEGKQYNSNTYVDDILKLSELKKTLE